MGLIFADSIIEKNSQYSDAIKQLLDKTILVEDRKTALNLFDSLESGWKVITVAGEIFDSRGIISGGTEVRVKPLKRKREKSTLEIEFNNSKTFWLSWIKKLSNVKPGIRN